MFEYITAGESHGPQITAVIKNLPSGLNLDISEINHQLYRRQQGYGRGGRMEIEADEVAIKSGVRKGQTLGSPLTMVIKNQDWENWQETMSIEKEENLDDFKEEDKVTQPRPGHADLVGAVKFNFSDMRNALERASARETAARTAVGSVCRQFISRFGIKIYSHVIQIGDVQAPEYSGEDPEKFFSRVEASDLRCGSKERENEMKSLINKWREKGDSVGGVFEIIVTGVPIGLGSYVNWDEKLEAKLAQAIMSIQAIKGVEVGAGFAGAAKPGSEFHDEIFYNEQEGFNRSSNNAGGFEGGVTNGEYISIKAAMKPIPTLATPLQTVDFSSKERAKAARERADVCAVPSASIVGEAVTAIEIAGGFAEKFGGDNMEEISANYNTYKEYIRDI